MNEVVMRVEIAKLQWKLLLCPFVFSTSEFLCYCYLMFKEFGKIHNTPPGGNTLLSSYPIRASTIAESFQMWYTEGYEDPLLS